MSNYRNLLENWNKFLTEEETIDEVTEEELSNIDDILHNLDPQDLSFNNIFGDRMRIIQPMKTKDKNLESLKNVLHKSGYEPDFSTGLATYYTINFEGTNPQGERIKPVILTLEQRKEMLDEDGVPKRFDGDTDEDFEKRKKLFQKKQIKIGKLLQKAARLYDAAHKTWKTADEINPEQFGISPHGDDDEDIHKKTDEYRVAAKEAAAKSRKDLQKLFDVFQGWTSRASSAQNIFKILADWWNKKSAFYRENPEETETTDSDYSIIYTRHPLDVMRMSDFENMTSCHSPPSRPSSSGNSFYKCAVAEAHGHGPVAYVVRNSDLDDWISSSAQSFEEYQEFLDFIEESDEELFLDTTRGTGEITPVSRVRLKKFVNPKLEVSLAVPSGMTYGKRFPDLYSNISEFAKEKQAEELAQINDAPETFDEDSKFNLANWERFGGSYQDAGDYPGEAIYKWLGYRTSGKTHYDETTEDNLNIQGSVLTEWEEAVSDIQNRFNQRMDAINVDASVEDDGAGEYYIDVNAQLKLSFDEGKFISSAHSTKTQIALEYLPRHLKEYGYDWLNDWSSYTTINHNNNDWSDLIRAAIDDVESAVVMDIPINIEEVNPDGGGYAYDPDNFENICEMLDRHDDEVAAIHEIAINYLKREGIVEGASLIQFATALEDESWYEWDYDVDDDWNPTSIEVQTNAYVNFEDLAQKLPITLERARSDQSGEVYVLFDGDPLALASQASDGDGNFKYWEVRSPEFESDMFGGFKDLDEVKDYVRDQLTKLILRPKGSKTPRGLQSSRDYLLAVSNLMREAAGGDDGEFAYPYRTMWVNGPDSDDEYKMMFGMSLDDDTPDEVVKNAHKIITETDDEDQLKDIFRTAFAKAGKIPGAKATLTETKQYFKKFDIF